MLQANLFWPIPRDVLAIIDADEQHLRRFRSLVTYQFLFGGKLVIRDSDYLNCLSLRQSMMKCSLRNRSEHYDFFRAAITDRAINIACRNEKSLGETAEGLLGHGSSHSIPHEFYSKNSEDISALVNSGALENQFTFSLSEASLYYTNQVLAILNRSLEPDLPDELRVKLYQKVSEQVHEDGVIGWEFLSEEGRVWQEISNKDKIRYGDFVYRILGQAPHAGFIPDTLGINPIYMNDVARCIDLWRGRIGKKKELIEAREFDLGGGFSFSDYVECLSVLPLDSIAELTLSEECQAFQQTSIAYAQENQDIEAMQEAYFSYRRRIDEQILCRIAYPRSGGRLRAKAFKSELAKEGKVEVVNLILDEIVGNSIPFWKLGYSTYTWLRSGEWPQQHSDRIATEGAMKDVSTLIQSIQKTNDRIESKILGESSGGIDRPVMMGWGVSRDICVSDQDD